MNRRAALLFLLYLGAILYVSLYPVHAGFPPGASALRWVPVSTRAEWVDFILNIVFYAPLGAAAFFALRARRPAIFGATLICASISLAVEYAQLSIPSRDGNLVDLAANSLGALLGAALPFAARRIHVFTPPKALFAVLWIAWQGFLILRVNWSVIEVAHELVGLMILAMVFSGRTPRAAGPLLLVWLAVEELRPFRFHGPPEAFSWIPFAGWVFGGPESYYGIIAGKFFLYTAVIWVLGRTGAPMPRAFLLPAVVLTVGEFAQRYLSGRSPEITDLILLAAGGALLHLTGADS